MDLKGLFKDFNASKFFLFICLLPFSILLSLKLDGEIQLSFWVVFAPLWLFNLAVVAGAVAGTIVWCRNPQYRSERDGYTDYKAMMITTGMQFLIFMFEVLLCDNVSNERTNMWILIFTPIFFVFPVSVAVCVWSFRNGRSLELELVISINILLFVFVALKLDGVVGWSWTAVLIPLWVVMCAPCIAVLYYLVWTLIFFRSTYPDAGRSHLLFAVSGVCVVVPLLTFQVLLAHRLDGMNGLSWTAVFAPLHISIIALIISSFGSKGGNKWWFGIRADFCLFLLQRCPCLRLYGNIAYRSPPDDDVAPEAPAPDSHICGAAKKSPPSFGSSRYGPVVTVECIETPD